MDTVTIEIEHQQPVRKPLIQVANLTKVYGMGDSQVVALNDVSLEIGENEFVAIMGPSGSGKSTLMNLIGCLDRPTSGRFYLAGEDVSQLNKAQLAQVRSKRIGFVFQGFNLLPRTTALENVILPLVYNRNGRLSEAEKVQQGLKALESVGLADRVHHLPHELSGGQMQRVAIARALINDPLLILADGRPATWIRARAGRLWAAGAITRTRLHNLNGDA
jgi:putative ABC transport system ATP-binding protein